MKKVYIASPYTVGGTAENVGRQVDAAHELIEAGFCPYAPTLNHYINIMHPRDNEDWMQQDFEWVKVCDYILRLNGFSPGADREVALAKELDIPVVYSMHELLVMEGKLE